MFSRVCALKSYWNTYPDQQGYLDYTDKTFMDDALYGIGIAVDYEKYKSADGYELFKKDLREFLNTK